MPTESLLPPERLIAAAALLDEIRRTGKAKPRQQAIAIAHGLAFDPHVDGRLRLTPVGVERLERVS